MILFAPFVLTRGQGITVVVSLSLGRGLPSTIIVGYQYPGAMASTSQVGGDALTLLHSDPEQLTASWTEYETQETRS